MEVPGHRDSEWLHRDSDPGQGDLYINLPLVWMTLEDQRGRAAQRP